MKGFTLFLLAALMLLAGCTNDSDKFAKEKNCPGCNLMNAYFREAILPGTDLSKANLQAAELGYSNFKGANFRGAFMFNANLHGADLSGADLTDAFMVMTTLRNANLEGAIIKNTDFSGAIWTNGIRCRRKSIDTCYFSDRQRLEEANICDQCQLYRSNFEGKTFKNVNFTKAILTEVNFKFAKLIDCDFTAANLKGSKMDGAEITGSNFEGAIWTDGEVCTYGSIGKCIKEKKN